MKIITFEPEYSDDVYNRKIIGWNAIYDNKIIDSAPYKSILIEKYKNEKGNK